MGPRIDYDACVRIAAIVTDPTERRLVAWEIISMLRRYNPRLDAGKFEQAVENEAERVQRQREHYRENVDHWRTSGSFETE